MITAALEFESFDTEEVIPVQSADYKKGYEAALAEVLQADAAKTAQALSEIATTLSDMSFGFTEARVHLLDLLRPLLLQTADAAIPMILKDSFGVFLVESITETFESALDEPVEISVSPAALDCLRNAMPSSINTRFKFIEDQQLDDGQAILRQSTKHLMIDMPALAETLQKALSGLETLERKNSHAG